MHNSHFKLTEKNIVINTITVGISLDKLVSYGVMERPTE